MVGPMFRMPMDRGAQESRAKPRPKTGSAVQIHREIVGRWHFGTLRNTLNTTRLHLRGGYCEWQRVSVEGKFWINRAHRRRPSLEKQSLVLYWSTGTWLKTVRPNWERPCFQKHQSTLWNPRAVGVLFQFTIDPLLFCTINTGPIKDKSASVMWIFINLNCQNISLICRNVHGYRYLLTLILAMWEEWCQKSKSWRRCEILRQGGARCW